MAIPKAAKRLKLLVLLTRWQNGNIGMLFPKDGNNSLETAK